MKDEIDADNIINILKDRAENEAICGYLTAYDVTNSIIDEIDEQPTAYDVREKTIEDSKEAVAKAICIGCGYLKETECTYTGQNCRSSHKSIR